jgi:hypothetical protein
MKITDDEIEKHFKPKLTPEFLELLAELIEVTNWTYDAVETESLYRGACRLAGVEPRALDLEY